MHSRYVYSERYIIKIMDALFFFNAAGLLTKDEPPLPKLPSTARFIRRQLLQFNLRSGAGATDGSAVVAVFFSHPGCRAKPVRRASSI